MIALCQSCVACTRTLLLSHAASACDAKRPLPENSNCPLSQICPIVLFGVDPFSPWRRALSHVSCSYRPRLTHLRLIKSLGRSDVCYRRMSLLLCQQSSKWRQNNWCYPTSSTVSTTLKARAVNRTLIKTIPALVMLFRMCFIHRITQ